MKPIRWPWVSRRAHEQMYNQMLALWRTSSEYTVASLDHLSARIDRLADTQAEAPTPERETETRQ